MSPLKYVFDVMCYNILKFCINLSFAYISDGNVEYYYVYHLLFHVHSSMYILGTCTVNELQLFGLVAILAWHFWLSLIHSGSPLQQP